MVSAVLVVSQINVLATLCAAQTVYVLVIRATKTMEALYVLQVCIICVSHKLINTRDIKSLNLAR